MTERLIDTAEVQALLNQLSGADTVSGDPRMKAIVRRVVGDLFATIEEFDVSDDELWQALNYAVDKEGLLKALLYGTGMRLLEALRLRVFRL